MNINYGKEVHLGESTQIKLIKHVLVTSSRQDHMTNWNDYISTTVAKTIKIGRTVT